MSATTGRVQTQPASRRSSRYRPPPAPDPEVGRAGVITDEAAHAKKILFHPKMLPQVVITDPALMAGLHSRLTAATGMDALAHCLEAYCALGYHPMADGIALEGMRLIHENLEAAVNDGKNLGARAGMAAAAMTGAVAFQKGLGAIHALSHPVGALYDTHPRAHQRRLHALRAQAFNRPAISERMAAAARYLGFDDPSLDGVIAWVLDLRRKIGIPNTLARAGVGCRPDPAELAKMAAVDPTASGNPVPLDIPSLEDTARGRPRRAPQVGGGLRPRAASIKRSLLAGQKAADVRILGQSDCPIVGLAGVLGPPGAP